MTEAGDGNLQRVRGEGAQFAAAADGKVGQENASSELGVEEVGNLLLQVEEERGREIEGEGEGDKRVANLQQQQREAEERRSWRRRSTFTERSTRRRRRREVWLSLIQSWEEKERGRRGDGRELTRSTVVQSRVKSRGEKQRRSRRDDEGLSTSRGRSTGVASLINTRGSLTGKEREEQRRGIIDESLERGMTAMGVRDVVLSPASAFAGSPATTPTVAAWHFPGAVPSSAPTSVSAAGWHLPTAAASPAVGWHFPAAVGSPAPIPTSAKGWHFPASVATPPPTSMASAGWHFPSGVASSAPNSVSAPGFSRHRRYSAPPIPPEFVGCGYYKHPRAAAFRTASQLPTCSPTCTDCPTSTRLLLMLHSMRLGVDPDVWTPVPVNEPLPMERSRWGRSCMPKKRRRPPRPSAVSSEVVARRSSASEPMIPPFNVLITGSTKGIGYALAKEFLRHGDNVIICSRSEERVQKALKELTKEFGEHRAWGTTCDVRDGRSVRALADFGKSQLGYIDIWINNAGTNAYSYKALVDTQDDAIAEIVSTNTLGVMLCCRQGIKTMMEQPRGGHIFNMDGAGADGNPTPRFAAYGATKRSLAQFTKSLQAELKQQGIKDVIVHNLSPGMVTTDLLMSGSDTRQAKFFINVLAEPAEEVAQYLVPRIRAIPGDKNRSSKYIRFLTGFKAYTQILARLIFKARKDRFVTED